MANFCHFCYKHEWLSVQERMPSNGAYKGTAPSTMSWGRKQPSLVSFLLCFVAVLCTCCCVAFWKFWRATTTWFLTIFYLFVLTKTWSLIRLYLYKDSASVTFGMLAWFCCCLVDFWLILGASRSVVTQNHISMLWLSAMVVLKVPSPSLMYHP